MLYNRKFEIPEEVSKGNFNRFGTANGWDPVALGPSISFLSDKRVFYSPSVSQKITKSPGDDPTPAGIEQHGYRYVMPHIAANQRIDDPFLFRAGKRYPCSSRDQEPRSARKSLHRLGRIMAQTGRRLRTLVFKGQRTGASTIAR